MISHLNLFKCDELTLEEVETKHEYKEMINSIFLPCFYESINLFHDKKLDVNSTEEKIKTRIRDLVLLDKGIPVLCGSSFKNKAIGFLLDSIVDFLPEDKNDIETISGKEKRILKRSDDEIKAGLIFKIIADKYLENLAIFRVYSGLLKVGESLKNSANNKIERIGRIIRLESDKKYDIEEAHAGESV